MATSGPSRCASTPTAGATARRHRAAGSYFPFSAGPYECHARGLATTEAILVLATLGQRWAFRPVDEREPQPVATGTIAPKGGLRMRPTARHRA